MAGAVQLAQVDLVEIPVSFVSDGEAGGDPLINKFVQLLQLQPLFPDTSSLHPAADIHADQIGHYLIGDGHGSANGAARTGMNVRHQTDSAACGKFLVTQLLNLGNGGAVHHVSKDFGLVVFSFNFDHSLLTIIFVGHCPALLCSRGV